VHVLPLWTPPIADVPLGDAIGQAEFDTAARHRAQTLLQAATERARSAGLNATSQLLDGAQPVQALCDHLAGSACQLLVVGTDSRSLVWSLLGGDPVPGLIRHACVPVLVCGPRGRP
jgi:nucleotide-binding universal stress UspA family protein